MEENNIINSIISLKEKFSNVKSKGWIKSVKKGTGSIGITFENAIGKEQENFEWPDYEGIEIKTTTAFAGNSICLFCAAPDGKYLFETKRLWEKFGFPCSKYPEKKIFYAVASTNKKTTFFEDYKMKLEVCYEEERVYLYIYKNQVLVDKNTYWSFGLLKEKLFRKLKYLALIDGKHSVFNSSGYFKYTDINFYKLRNFDNFLYILEKGYIKITFSISIFLSGRHEGKLHDHGTKIAVYKSHLLDLFEYIEI